MHWYRSIIPLIFVCGCFLLFLAACTPEPETADSLRQTATATATSVPATATVPPTATTILAAPTEMPSPTAVPSPTATDVLSPTRSFVEESYHWLSAVNAVEIYSGPGSNYDQVGVLEAGAAVKVTGEMEGDWFPIACPDSGESCWVVWDWNALYSYEGPEPVVFNIPQPDSLPIVSTNTTISPGGGWQVEMTRSETAWLAGESAGFFYVEMKVQSLNDDRVFTPVSEWHSAGLGEEGPPQIFHWSADGRYLYYTRTFDYHGVMCALYVNIGDNLNRLDLNDGNIAPLLPPLPRNILTISPDEAWIAYLSSDDLIVRELAAAYSDGDDGQNSIKWQIPLDQVGTDPISEVAWSPDTTKVLVVTTKLTDDCQLASRSTWELDMASGSFTLASTVTE